MSASSFMAEELGPDGGAGDAPGTTIAAKPEAIPASAPATITAREAHFMSRRMTDAASAVGELSADLICPYPPGIPLLVPGEPITAEALSLLGALRAAGCSLTGCSDPELDQLAVLERTRG